MIQPLDQGQDLPNISVLYALQWLEASWNDLTKATTVINFFRKAKISKENQTDAAANMDDRLSEQRQYNPELVSEELTAEDVVNLIQML